MLWLYLELNSDSILLKSHPASECGSHWLVGISMEISGYLDVITNAADFLALLRASSTVSA